MGSDDLKDVLDDQEADLEARFRELEQEAEIERLRSASGAPSREQRGPAGQPAAPSAASSGASDPLADLKAAVEGSAEMPLYLLVLCPHCEARNRVGLAKVRTLRPICGRCKKELAFTKP
jgi:hypothetical protein